jgi:hypothetical protein
MDGFEQEKPDLRREPELSRGGAAGWGGIWGFGRLAFIHNFVSTNI